VNTHNNYSLMPVSYSGLAIAEGKTNPKSEMTCRMIANCCNAETLNMQDGGGWS